MMSTESNVKSALRQGRFSTPLSSINQPNYLVAGGGGFEDPSYFTTQSNTDSAFEHSFPPLKVMHQSNQIPIRSQEDTDKKYTTFQSQHHHFTTTNGNGSRMNNSNTATTKKKKNKKDKELGFPTHGFGKSGLIQSRTDTKSLVFRNWTHCCWLHVFPATIHLFESEEKMLQWKDASEGKRQGNVSSIRKLVKFTIDFDTMKKLQKQIDFHRKKQLNKSAVNKAILITKDDLNDKTDIHRPIHYVLEEVRSKYYTNNGPLMHTCKISYFEDSGRNIMVALGSEHPEEVKRIRSVIRHCITLVGKAVKRDKKARDGGKDISDLSSWGGSVISGMNKSAVTALSSTKYEEVTASKYNSIPNRRRRK